VTQASTRTTAATAVDVAEPRRWTAVLTLLTLLAACLVTGVVAAPRASASEVEDVFTSRINKARSAAGVHRLTTRAHLVSVARSWAARMADQNRLYHNPRLTSDVTNWRYVGENVGYGPTAVSVHVAFMNSPGHRANILDRDFTEVGVGAVVRDGRVWVAEVFRRPARTTRAAATQRSSSSRATFRHTLRYGSKGAAVRRVQDRLGLRQSGFYGRSTKAAVSRFQKRQGWRGRGNCGPKTWARLF
jgi:uncharacterized protein YkwD